VVRDAGVYSLEVAVLFLVAMAVVMSLVQIGLWWYSRDVAITAAASGKAQRQPRHPNPQTSCEFLGKQRHISLGEAGRHTSLT